jgi:hypothetical protein
MTRHRIHTTNHPEIRPIGIYPYFDKVQVWVRTPFDREALAQLENACGRGGIHEENRPARFDALLRQRIELRQPTVEALQQLAQRSDTLINKVEIAIDYLFDSPVARDDAWEFFHRHLIRRWHSTRQRIVVDRGTQDQSTDGEGRIGTRYDAERRARNMIVFYRDEQSRRTGELNCLHLEWRLNGLEAVRNVGIESGQGLLEFNHRQFWQKRLRLYDVDRHQLGRLINNRLNRTRRRTSVFEQRSRYRINLDGRTGENHLASHDTIQELIDHLKGTLHLERVRRALVPISIESLLPE